MEFGLFAKNPAGEPKLLLSYSLPRRSKSCVPRPHGALGDHLAGELDRAGVDQPQRAPGMGAVQAFPEDGLRFLKALFAYRRWSDYLEVRVLDQDAERLRRRLNWATRRPSNAHQRQADCNDVILRQATICREVKRLKFAQRAQLYAIRRSIENRTNLFVLSVPRFSPVAVGPGLTSAVADPPGRAEMIVGSQRDLLGAFQKETRRINAPTPDLVTRLLLHLS